LHISGKIKPAKTGNFSLALTLVIDQYTGNEVVITKSFTAYLYLQVRKVLYSQTAGEKFERWCIERRINLFTLDDGARERAKAKFEAEEKE